MSSKAALLVVGVRDAVTDGWLLAGDFANAGHTNNLENSVTWEQRDQVPSPGPDFIPARGRDLKAGGAIWGLPFMQDAVVSQSSGGGVTVYKR